MEICCFGNNANSYVYPAPEMGDNRDDISMIVTEIIFGTR